MTASPDIVRIRRRNVVVRLIVAALLALVPALVAQVALAENIGTNVTPNTSSYDTAGTINYFVYAKEGEFIRFAGSDGSRTVTQPDGTQDTGPVADPASQQAYAVTSDNEGVWTALYAGNSAWGISVYDGDPDDVADPGTPIFGRIWTDRYQISQSGSSGKDLTFWMINDDGYEYAVKQWTYNGQASSLMATDVGVSTAASNATNCVPSDRSWDRPHPGHNVPCANKARMFFAPPADDLPASAPIWSATAGATVTQSVKPAPFTPDAVVASGFSFDRTGPGTQGAFDYDIGSFTGSHLLQIDVDGNGSYDDAVDRSVRAKAALDGSVEVDFDGLDGTGDLISPCVDLTARVLVDRVGEIHMMQDDVEMRGGIEVIRQNGAGAPSDTIFWDDTQLGSRDNTTPVLDGTSGVASTGAVHGWSFDSNSWGNSRMIDDFAYVPTNRVAGTTTIDGDCAPGLTLTKSSTLDDTNSNGLADIGEEISYSFLVENTGTVDMTDVTIDDDRVSNISPASADIAWAGQQVFTADPYVVTQADINAGEVLNEATASGSHESTTGPKTYTSDPDTETTSTPARVPGLTIEKTGNLVDANGNGVADAGETINYEFDVENTGNVTLTGVTVDDPKLSSVSPGPVTLAPGASQTFTASYVAQSSDTSVGAVYNVATATGTSPLGPFRSTPDDVTIDSPDPDASLSLAKDAALTTDQDDDDEADLDDVITYTFTVENTGNVDLEDIVINDPNIGATSPASADIAAGDSQVFTATYVVKQADVDADTVFNSATASGVFPNGANGPEDVDSPPDTVTMEVDQNPGLSIQKSSALDDGDDDGFADVGEEITYTFTVENTGNTTLEDIVVVDPKIGATTPGSVDLVVGASADLTATYVTTQADVDNGVVHNEAVARGTVPGGAEAVSPPDSDDVPVPPADPSLSIVKDVTLLDDDNDDIADKGESLIYSFEVTNTGNVTLHNVTVDDQMLDDAGLGLNPVSASLAPGESLIFEAEPYVVTGKDVKGGKLKNVATATGTDPSGDDVESDPGSVVIVTSEGNGGGDGSGNGGGGLIPDTGGPALLWALAAVATIGCGALMVRSRRSLGRHLG